MKTIIAFLIITTCLFACASSTSITGSWKSPAAGEQSITSVLITAMTARTNARQKVEDDIATSLQENGIKAIRSIDVMPPSFTDGKEPDREEIMNKINDTDADAILTVALIDQETETRYVPGTYGYEPVPRFWYYGRFWGYYNNWYPTLYSPGYYEEDKIYFIETNLYDADTEELLWSAQSETMNPRDLPTFAEEFADVVVKRMISDGALGKRTPDDFVDRDR